MLYWCLCGRDIRIGDLYVTGNTALGLLLQRCMTVMDLMASEVCSWDGAVLIGGVCVTENECIVL